MADLGCATACVDIARACATSTGRARPANRPRCRSARGTRATRDDSARSGRAGTRSRLRLEGFGGGRQPVDRKRYARLVILPTWIEAVRFSPLVHNVLRSLHQRVGFGGALADGLLHAVDELGAD